MCPFRVSRFIGRVPAELGLQERLVLSQCEVEIHLHAQPQAACRAFEDVPAVLSVIGQKVQVTAGMLNALERSGDHGPTSVPAMSLN